MVAPSFLLLLLAGTVSGQICPLGGYGVESAVSLSAVLLAGGVQLEPRATAQLPSCLPGSTAQLAYDADLDTLTLCDGSGWIALENAPLEVPLPPLPPPASRIEARDPTTYLLEDGALTQLIDQGTVAAGTVYLPSGSDGSLDPTGMNGAPIFALPDYFVADFTAPLLQGGKEWTVAVVFETSAAGAQLIYLMQDVGPSGAATGKEFVLLDSSPLSVSVQNLVFTSSLDLSNSGTTFAYMIRLGSDKVVDERLVTTSGVVDAAPSTETAFADTVNSDWERLRIGPSGPSRIAGVYIYDEAISNEDWDQLSDYLEAAWFASE